VTGSWLAVDGGQSGIRLRDGTTGREAVAPGVRHGHAGVVPGLVASLDAAVAAIGLRTPVTRAVLGLSGLPTAPEAVAELDRAVRDLTGATEVWLAGDHVTAHAGATGGRAGVVVTLGTGAAALGVAPDGRLRTVDGRGYLFGDDGSAFQIGRTGLVAALRAADRRGPATALLGAAEDRWEPLGGLTDRLYRAPDVVAQVAGFAVDVLRTVRLGDAVAAEIVRAAMSDLARSVRAAAADWPPGEPVDVHVVGGLARGADVLLPPLDAALADVVPAARRLPARGSALDGAALFAARDDPRPYTAALHILRPAPARPASTVRTR
jgi:glucosamine kinase